MTIGVGGLVALISGGPVANEPEAEAGFVSPKAAYRAGIQSLAKDDVTQAVPALKFAAAHGVLGAQLRLAKLYSAEGEHRNDAGALTYYHMIINRYGDIDRLHPASRHVAEALRSLSRYYREGVPEIHLEPDPQRAAQLMRDAASYFRDPQAQFEIGKMYAEGNGVTRSARLAASWLLKASQKKYAPAQAYLGEMLWRADANDRLRAQGLALLALAVDNAGPSQRARIEAQYRALGENADTALIEQAEKFVAAWDSFRTPGGLQTASAKLRSLRATPLDAAPVGSFVVSDSPSDLEAGSSSGAVGALMRDIQLYLHYDISTSATYTDESIAPHPMEKFVRGQPPITAEKMRDDITTVEIDRFGGQMLSVGVGTRTQ
jgi:uncharacterized protein